MSEALHHTGCVSVQTVYTNNVICGEHLLSLWGGAGNGALVTEISHADRYCMPTHLTFSKNPVHSELRNLPWLAALCTYCHITAGEIKHLRDAWKPAPGFLQILLPCAFSLF